MNHHGPALITPHDVDSYEPWVPGDPILLVDALLPEHEVQIARASRCLSLARGDRGPKQKGERETYAVSSCSHVRPPRYREDAARPRHRACAGGAPAHVRPTRSVAGAAPGRLQLRRRELAGLHSA